MFWVYGLAIIVSFVVGYLMWPKDTRSFRVVSVSGLVIGSIIMLGIYITQWWPVERKVIQKVTKQYVDPPKVVFKDRIVYRVPDGEVAPVDVRGACKGEKPIQITQMNVNDSEKDSRITWITGHLVGSKILIVCGQPGDYSDSWKVGDIVQFIRGEPQ